METVAFALRKTYDGTTDQDGDEVPTFQGALISVAGDDFNVGDHLEAGQGLIVCSALDHQLVGVLDEFVPLKRVATPKGATAISPYARRSLEDLRHVASLRDITGHAKLNRADLIDALDVSTAGGEPAPSTDDASPPYEGDPPDTAAGAGSVAPDGADDTSTTSQEK